MGCGATKEEQAIPANKQTAAERKEAWMGICKELPRQMTPEDKARRIELFKEFDTQKNNKLSLDEVYNGCCDVMKLDRYTNHLYDIVKRAYEKAKETARQENPNSGDDVEFFEFRLMLCFIYDYFEMTVAFDEIDTQGNGVLSAVEFTAAAPHLKALGVPGMDDPEAVFKQIDSNGSGSVTFDEFAAWGSAMKMHIQAEKERAAAAAAVDAENA